MKKIDIDLDKLSSELLSTLAVETDDYDVLYLLYDIAIERGEKSILIGILENKRPETKETVKLIEQYARHEYEITDLDNIMTNKEDNNNFKLYGLRKEKLEEKYTEVRYDDSLKDYIATNPYASVDTLIDMLVWGELTPLLNMSLPNETLNAFIVSSSSLDLIKNNPLIIFTLINSLSYKLSDESLQYLAKVPFENDTYDTNLNAYEAMERRKAFRLGLPTAKQKVIETS